MWPAKRFIMAGLALLPVLPAWSASAQTAYPNRTITFIVPMAPGGPPDVISRMVIPQMTAPLGVSIIVDNKPGAGGAVGAGMVAKSAPDGYTVLAVTNNALSVIPATRKDLEYSLKDFAAIGGFATDPGVFVSRASDRWRDLDSLVAEAKKNPGRLSYGSAGVGTTTHLAMEAVKAGYGVDLTHVPFKGTQPAKAALLGGHINVAVGPVSVMMPNIKSGELVALVTTSRNRIPDLPNVPTASEKGVPQASFNLWVGLFVPAKTPKSVVDRLNTTLTSALKDPKVAESAEKLGMVLEFTDPAQTMSRLQAEYEAVLELAKTVPLSQ
jgi:tripartite-type tricarboxylate transporter receptor subunit TctC